MDVNNKQLVGSVICWPPIVRKAWLHQNRRMRCSDRTICCMKCRRRMRRRRKEKEHQKLASRMIASAEGGTGLLRKITEPTARRGRSAQFCTKKKMSSRQPDVRRRGKNWQSTGTVTRRCKFFFFKKKKHKPWRSRELQSLEAGMPSLRQR